MSVRIARTLAASAVIAGAVAAVIGGTASAATLQVDSRGTGASLSDPVITEIPGASLEKNPYKAEIFPLPGQKTPYNQSVGGGVASGVRLAIVKSDAGDTVYVTGYSQGARVAGDVGAELDSLGVSKNRKVIVITKSDPRQPGGVEDVYAPYTHLLPYEGYPFIQFQGVRAEEGNVQTTRYCKFYDGVCNTVDFFDNPGAAIASLLGYATGQHNYSDIASLPTSTVVRDGGYTVQVVVDDGNPVVKIANTVSQVLTGDKISDSQEELIEALTPIGQPGSGENVTPDPVRIASAAGTVAEEAYEEYAPEVAGYVVDAAVTGNTGNPVVGNLAGEIAEQVAEPIVNATAPLVGDVVARELEPVVSQGLAALQQVGTDIRALSPLPGLPLPAGH